MKNANNTLLALLFGGIAMIAAPIASADHDRYDDDYEYEEYGYRHFKQCNHDSHRDRGYKKKVVHNHYYHDRDRGNHYGHRKHKVKIVEHHHYNHNPEPRHTQRRYYNDYNTHAGYESHTPMILGGVLGGVIGSEMGKGRGKDAATLAGIILGGSIGRDIGNSERF